MSRRKGQTRTAARSCTGKRRFENAFDAHRLKDRLIAGGNAENSIRVYGPCRNCAGYHVGHYRERD